jgi:hypothetical protein
MWCWDGRSFREIPSPGLVISLHGIAPDFVYAVGAEGMISRWDGTAWKRVPGPTRSMLSSVYVASPDEMYAVGPGRKLLQGSVHGWVEVLTAPFGLHAVTKFAGDVLVGAGLDGLHRLRRNELEPVDPDIATMRFDSRRHLLVSGREAIQESADLTKFHRVPSEAFARMVEPYQPSWVR